MYLTHDQKDMFKTNAGAIFSIAFFITILSYGLVLTSNVWNNSILAVSQQQIFYDSKVTANYLNASLGNLSFAIGFQ